VVEEIFWDDEEDDSDLTRAFFPCKLVCNIDFRYLPVFGNDALDDSEWNSCILGDSYPKQGISVMGTYFMSVFKELEVLEQYLFVLLFKENTNYRFPCIEHLCFSLIGLNLKFYEPLCKNIYHGKGNLWKLVERHGDALLIKKEIWEKILGEQGTKMYLRFLTYLRGEKS